MCSTIVLGRGSRRVLAYNYDYALDHGLIGTNLRGGRKASVPPPGQEVVRWQVRHGSVTLCSFSLELPTCGINERGLCITMMWHDEGAFGTDASVLRLNPLQWIQYALDCHARVVDVIDDLERVQPRDDGVPLHFMILDAEGRCAVIEFLAGEPRITLDPEFPGLTNSTYQRSLDDVADDAALEDVGIKSSLGRFETLHRLCSPESDHAGERASAFALLGAVAQGTGDDDEFPWSRGDRRTRTVWSVLFDPRARRIVFNTVNNPALRELRLDDLDLSEDGVYQIHDIDAGAGDIGGALEAYDIAENRRIVSQSASLLSMPEAVQEEIVRVVDEIYARS